jgi:hypothetical protein
MKERTDGYSYSWKHELADKRCLKVILLFKYPIRSTHIFINLYYKYVRMTIRALN